ncbi:hypothetical protein HY994_00490 [Candidatus Micrarchaeota archaeon]|nr:hypothetical protein [Candidatus Micrarchaeota archaeon]
MEFDHQLLTHYLMDHLQSVIRAKNLPFRASEAFSILTTPLEDSYAQKEEMSLLKIATGVKDARVRKLFEIQDLEMLSTRLQKMDPALSQELDAHVESYCWLPYMYEGPAWDRRYFLQVLQGLLKADVDALLQSAQSRHARTQEQQKQLLSRLQLDEKHTQLLLVAQGMVFTKGFRKDALYPFFWRLEPFLKEVAKRLGLSLKQVRRLMPSEIPAALRKQAVVDADELNARFEHYVQYIHEGTREFFSGSEADTFMERIELETHDASTEVRELSGECACPGVVRGIARLIESPSDMAKMQTGDILIAHATNPDIVPAMKMAGAIVTDMGGITCHAAIVSRELKIPCVIGTKVATAVLKDGDAVEVDANHGKVTKIG